MSATGDLPIGRDGCYCGTGPLPPQRLPDEDPMTATLPPCPREDCTASGRHYHLTRTGGARPCPDSPRHCEQEHTAAADDENPCYAPRTPQPEPYRFPDGWERGHEAKCWLQTRLTPYGLTLDPERAPGVLNWLGVNYYTPDSPHLPQRAAVVLPTVDEVADVLRSGDGLRFYSDSARDILDLIAARLPVLPTVGRDDVRKGDRLRVVTTWDGVLSEVYPDALYIRQDDGSMAFWDPSDDETVTYLLHRPEPEDPRVAVVREWLKVCGPIDAGTEDARDLLARLDAARADA